jgi:hypothetical protein
VIWVLGNWHGAGAEVLVNGHNIGFDRYPTWDLHVAYLFSRPFWIVDSDPEAVGRHWTSQIDVLSPKLLPARSDLGSW